ncbi:T6SS immunity protein Tdi1 domain-containing protein [Clostridium butyricum]|uniref:T6SS immunity protein Tdi1 domain-containing protein n=1 Tax=Clostridium butyricum TaxID=1492 RepID=UPI0034675FE2
MNEDMKKVFSDFKVYKKVDENIIDKYKDIVGKDVVEIWEKYGFGSAFNGYFKIINPDDYQELLEETYIMPFDDIPVFITGMGDIITCNSRGSFTILDYRHQRLEILWTGKEIEWNYFIDEDYNKEYFQWDPYFEAVEKYGEPEYNECFGYEPLLSLGGKENIENLKKMNVEVHITIMGEIQGILSC